GPAGQINRGVFLLRIFLSFLTLHFFGLQLFFQIVGEGRAEGRILGGEKGFTLKTLAAPADGLRLDIHQSVFDGKQQRVLFQHLRFQQTERRVVIQNVEAAAKCSQNEIVLASLNVNVAHLNRRQPALELNPFLSGVDGKEEAKL